MTRHKVRKSRWRTDEWIAEGKTQDGRYYFEYFPTQQAALRYANAMEHLAGILTACKSLSIRRQVKNRKLHDH